MEEVSYAFKHGRYSINLLKSVRVMSNVKFFCHGRKTVGWTDEHD